MVQFFPKGAQPSELRYAEFIWDKVNYSISRFKEELKNVYFLMIIKDELLKYKGLENFW